MTTQTVGTRSPFQQDVDVLVAQWQASDQRTCTCESWSEQIKVLNRCCPIHRYRVTS